MILFDRLKARWEKYLELKLDKRENDYWLSQPLTITIKNSMYGEEALSAIVTLYDGCAFMGTNFNQLVRVRFHNCQFIGIGPDAFPSQMKAVTIDNCLLIGPSALPLKVKAVMMDNCIVSPSGKEAPPPLLQR